MIPEKWYARPCADGLWRPASVHGKEINVGFENRESCVRYLERAGLPIRDLKDRRAISPDLAKRIPPGEVKAFMEQWDKQTERTEEEARNGLFLEMSKLRVHLDEIRQGRAMDGVELYGHPPRPGECRHKSPPSRCAVCTAPDDPDYEGSRPDDDRCEWVDISTGDGRQLWIQGSCNHVPGSRVPVDAYPTGELVRWLCTDCGEAFPADRWACPEDMWVRVPDPMAMVRPVPRVAAPVAVVRRESALKRGVDRFLTAWVPMILILTFTGVIPLAVGMLGVLFGWWQ